jgi:signal transduction histidine kinase
VATDKLKYPEVTTKLAAALTSHDLFQALLSIAAPIEGSAAVVYLFDRHGELRRQSSRGAARWPERAEAIASGRGMFLETRAEIEAGDPATAHAETRFHAEAVLPLLAGGRLLGVFAVAFDRARQFEDDERQWLTRIAVQAGLAANRARLFEDLTQAVRVNELFVGVLAHDLRQPLNAVAMSAALLQSREGKDGTIDPRADRARARILKSAARMSRMIDQLLDFTRLRIGAGLSLEPATSELAPLVAQIAEEVCDGGPRDAVAVDSLGDTRGIWDADRLGQVVSNLIGNAVQHGGAGPSGVRVMVDGTEPESVRVRVHNVGTIAPDLLPKLFEPLTRAEHRRGRPRGLGLGLYIAKEIVAAHGGQLTVMSNEAEGTTFTVSLPRSCATATDRPTPPLPPGAAIAALHGFEQGAGPATALPRDARLPAFGVPTVQARLHAIKLQLELRRLEAAGLRAETRRLRDRFLGWPTRHGATRSRPRQDTASGGDKVRRSASGVMPH